MTTPPAPRERPILFSASMILALLAGRKTQTRRLAWAYPDMKAQGLPDAEARRRLPPSPWQKVKPGELLWVREAWKTIDSHDNIKPTVIGQQCLDAGYLGPWAPILYLADKTQMNWERGEPGRLRASIHMPRWLSRITLEVTAVRVEPLNDITEADAAAEGIVPHENGGYWVPGVEHDNKDFPYLSRPTAREMYAALWDTINGAGAWLRNPMVVVLSFTRIGK